MYILINNVLLIMLFEFLVIIMKCLFMQEPYVGVAISNPAVDVPQDRLKLVQEYVCVHCTLYA